MRQANDRLAALGQKRQVFTTLKQAQVTVEQAEKRAVKKLVAVAPKATVSALTTIQSLKSAIAAEKNPTSKINMLQDLRANLLTSMQSEKNHVKATELQREFMSADKKLAYNLLAERQLDPKAARARRLRDFADRE